MFFDQMTNVLKDLGGKTQFFPPSVTVFSISKGLSTTAVTVPSGLRNAVVFELISPFVCKGSLFRSFERNPVFLSIFHFLLR